MKTNTLLETGAGGCVWLGGIVEICDSALTWATFEPQTLGEEGQRGWLGCVCQLVLTLPVTVYIDRKVGAPRLGYAQLRSNFDSLNMSETSVLVEVTTVLLVTVVVVVVVTQQKSIYIIVDLLNLALKIIIIKISVFLRVYTVVVLPGKKYSGKLNWSKKMNGCRDRDC